MAARMLVGRVSSVLRLGGLRPASFARERRSESGEAGLNSEQPANNKQDSSIAVHDNPYFGISTSPFSQKIVDVLLAPINESDIEIKPDGLVYLPEIKYRRILNQAFGPGGWALMPRGETLHFQNDTEGAQLITREYAMYVDGRFVAQSMGEHTFYSRTNLSYGKACESAKSNALMRCCKDLGVASGLWDPQFVSKWKRKYAMDVWCENVRTKDKKRLWRRKDVTEPFPYPWREQKSM